MPLPFEFLATAFECPAASSGLPQCWLPSPFVYRWARVQKFLFPPQRSDLHRPSASGLPRQFPFALLCAMAWAALPSTSDVSSPTNSWLQNATAVVVPRRLTEVSNWAAMKTACDSSGTVTLSDGFVMGTYISEILFADKQLVIMGNGKILDAGQNG